mgnify:CR=1 FL=1
MKKVSAVEWLIEQMKKYNITVSVHTTSHENVSDFYSAIEQAKEMEAEREAKYQKMLEMLKIISVSFKHRNLDVSDFEKLEQLIKEVEDGK